MTTTSPDPRREPQRSELEAIRDATANTPQRDNYADDPSVLEPFEDDRDAKAVLAVALELPTPSLDRSNLPDPDATTADVCDLCKKPAGHLSPVSGAGFRACVSCYTKDPAACTWCKERPSALWEAPSGDVLCDTCRETYAKGYVLLAASTIRPEEVEWYYEGRVPLGSLTLLVGQAGLGKTMFACELSACGSRGQLGSPAAAVIFATAEDSLAHTLVPRFTAAGADLDRVHFVSIRGDDGLETGLTLPEDNAVLQTAVEKTGANLIILDPVVGHLSGNIDSHKDHSVRRALAPLAALAESTGAAILGIGHLNKAHSTDVLTRLGGSVAFGAAARSVLLFGEDSDAAEGSSERLLIHAKSNLGPLAVATRLKVAGRTIITTDGREIRTSVIKWLGEDPTATPSKVLAGRQDPSRLDDATDFLRDVLADGPLPSLEVTALAAAEGIAKRTLKRAKQKLGIEFKRKGYGPGSAVHWSLPKDAGIPHTGPTFENWPSMENQDPADGQETVVEQGVSHTSPTSVVVEEIPHTAPTSVSDRSDSLDADVETVLEAFPDAEVVQGRAPTDYGE